MSYKSQTVEFPFFVRILSCQVSPPYTFIRPCKNNMWIALTNAVVVLIKEKIIFSTLVLLAHACFMP